MHKIVLVGSRNPDTCTGGIEIHTARVIDEFTKSGHLLRIYWLTFDGSQGFVCRKYSNVIHINVRASIKLGKFTTSLRWFFLFLKIKPHLVHVHGLGTALVCLLIKVFLRKIALVFTHHDLGSSAGERNRLEAFALRICEQLVGAADISTSVMHRDSRASRFIANGVSTASAESKREAMQLLATNDLEPHGFFLSTGRFTRQKGTIDILKAYMLADVGYPLLLIGTCDGECESIVAAAQRNLSGNCRVRFLGPMRHDLLLGVTAMSGCYISASYYEAFGLGTHEAFAMGRPMLLSEIAAHDVFASSLIRRHKVGDFNALAKDIQGTELRSLSHTRTQARKYRTWSMVAEEYIEVYQQVLM